MKSCHMCWSSCGMEKIKCLVITQDKLYMNTQILFFICHNNFGAAKIHGK